MLRFLNRPAPPAVSARRDAAHFASGARLQARTRAEVQPQQEADRVPVLHSAAEPAAAVRPIADVRKRLFQESAECAAHPGDSLWPSGASSGSCREVSQPGCSLATASNRDKQALAREAGFPSSAAVASEGLSPSQPISVITPDQPQTHTSLSSVRSRAFVPSHQQTVVHVEAVLVEAATPPAQVTPAVSLVDLTGTD